MRERGVRGVKGGGTFLDTFSLEVAAAENNKHSTFHRQNRFIGFLVQLYFHRRSPLGFLRIFTPSEVHDGVGRAGNMNVCVLGPLGLDFM